MTRHLPATALGAAWLAVLLVAHAKVDDPGATRLQVEKPPGVTIYEDGSGSDGSPEGTYRWDCRTMGNRVCGP